MRAAALTCDSGGNALLDLLALIGESEYGRVIVSVRIYKTGGNDQTLSIKGLFCLPLDALLDLDYLAVLDRNVGKIGG